jgi:NADH:ubiquinone oxidoreductase subunit 4 (subunit M)
LIFLGVLIIFVGIFPNEIMTFIEAAVKSIMS